MNTIDEIYCTITELFGPNIKVEILKINNNEFVHIVGDEIYQSVKKKKRINKRELGKIFGIYNFQKEEEAFESKIFKPENKIKQAIEVNDYILEQIDLFPSFVKHFNFTYQSDRYLVLLSTPLLNHQENIKLLESYIKAVKDKIDNRNGSIMMNYLKTFIPKSFKDDFELIFNLSIKMSMQKIENKETDFGLIYVNDYLEFKSRFNEKLFFDLEGDYDIKNIELIRQPFMEITGGKKSFLLVNKEFKIKGIFFPKSYLEGLELNDKYENSLNNCLVVRIKGVNLIRLVCNNKIVFDIQNGLTRTRDYNSFFNALKNILSLLNIKEYQNEFFYNLVDISNFKKGTIIVIGDKINENNYNKCIKGSIDLIYNEEYRSNILTQLSLTDGAILLNNKFNIYGFGAILKINGNTDITNHTGGSRTYTVEQFAKENKKLVLIKISEDGPISVYYNGECKIAI